MMTTEVSLDITGMSEVVKLIGDMAIPWRRKHLIEMNELAREEKRLSNEEIELRLKAEEKKQRLHTVELENQRLDLEERRLAIEERKLKLQGDKIQLALDVLDQISPNLPETEKINYVIRLLPPLEVIISSPLELSVEAPEEGQSPET
jgi:predicted nuclease with TOPRIM domain